MQTHALTPRAVLEAAKGCGRVLIALKCYGHDVSLENRVAQIVEKTWMAEDVMIMSLKHRGLARIRSLRRDWPTGIVAGRAFGDLVALNADFLAVKTGEFSGSPIRRAHGIGKRAQAWTLDDPRKMSRTISKGATGSSPTSPYRPAR